MRIRLALLLASLALASMPATAGAKDKEKSRKERERDSKKKKDREPERPRVPPSLQLESLDLRTARAVAIVGGATRAPDSRLFAFHDDRERHFIALNAECEPAKVARPATTTGDGDKREGEAAPATDDGMRCELELPRDYVRRGNWVKFTVRVSGREVEADPEALKAVFERARKALPPEPVAKSRPRAPIRRGNDPAATPVEDPGMPTGTDGTGEGSGEDEGGGEPTGD